MLWQGLERTETWGARKAERLSISFITDVLMIVVSVSWEARIRETHQVARGCSNLRSKHVGEVN